MSAGFHYLGTNVPGKVTGYHARSLPTGLLLSVRPAMPAAAPRSAPRLEATLIAGEEGAPKLSAQQARASGYTGDECPTCHSVRMKRAGACLTCEDCGNSTSCG